MDDSALQLSVTSFMPIRGPPLQQILGFKIRPFASVFFLSSSPRVRRRHKRPGKPEYKPDGRSGAKGDAHDSDHFGVNGVVYLVIDLVERLRYNLHRSARERHRSLKSAGCGSGRGAIPPRPSGRMMKLSKVRSKWKMSLVLRGGFSFELR